MSRNDMRKVDLNLLMILAALMGERNFTRVSEKRFLGQRRLTLRIGLSCVPEQHASARRPRYSMLWRRPRASL
jgi:hypothetical protein